MAGTSPHSMLTGLILFFTCELTGLVLAVIGGSLMDILEVNLVGAGLLETGDWNNTFYTGLINIFYWIPYILGVLGIFILLTTIYQRYGKDKQDEEEDETYYINGGQL